jgi:NhaA family Na+:H+ antiporter
MARREALSPTESLIATLHPWVAFCIMPLFALANAGVRVSGGLASDASWAVAGGVGLGLVVGKPLGVLLATELVVRLGIGRLPIGLTTKHIFVLGIVAGIGFTMSLFVAQLAFSDATLLSAAKLGVLAASCTAALLALITGYVVLPRDVHAQAAQTADEAEASTEH